MDEKVLRTFEPKPCESPTRKIKPRQGLSFKDWDDPCDTFFLTHRIPILAPHKALRPICPNQQLLQQLRSNSIVAPLFIRFRTDIRRTLNGRTPQLLLSHNKLQKSSINRRQTGPEHHVSPKSIPQPMMGHWRMQSNERPKSTFKCSRRGPNRGAKNRQKCIQLLQITR